MASQIRAETCDPKSCAGSGAPTNQSQHGPLWRAGVRITTRALALALLLLLGPARAGADVSPAALDGLSADPPAGATLPLTLQFIDEGGAPRTLGNALGAGPAVLIFADYTCRTLCGPILALAAAGLERTGLRAGTDYHLIVIGLDPNDGLDAASRMKAAQLGSQDAVGRAAVFLTGTEPEITAVTAAAGYRYAYDRAHDQFAHPAAAYILDRDGRITRVLSPLGLSGPDLRLALVAAGQGRVGSLGDRLRLLCYGYDPQRGIYTATIALWLSLAAAATVIALAGGIILMSVRTRNRVPT